MEVATRVWLVLVAATLGSFGVAELLPDRFVAVPAILLVAAIKIRLILEHFMELHATPMGLRIVFHAWTAACAVLIAGLCCYALA